MAEAGGLWQYDLFVSYVDGDTNTTGTLARLCERLSAVFAEQTGRALRLFVARDVIPSATLWDQRIQEALNASATMLAVHTRSYFHSEACCREWDTFLILERARRRLFSIPPDESLVFPVLIHPIADVDGRTRPDRTDELRQRQFVDLTESPPGTPMFDRRTGRLAADLVTALGRLSVRRPDRPEPAAPDGQHTAGPAGISTPQVTTPLVTTHAGSDQDRLTLLLAEAKSATLVGISNTWVPACVEAALVHRRRNDGVDAFWDRLDVVFLSEDLLPYVKDEYSIEFPDPHEALRHRIRRAGAAKRQLMSLLLRSNAPGRWSLRTSPHLLPFIGNLFSMRDGHRVVQLSITRHSRREGDNLYVDFLDRVDQFFESAFREVVEASTEEHEVVLVGTPGPNRTFLTRTARFRRAVLVEGRNASDWLPAVVALTWRDTDRGPEPLLQVNTPQNSTREIGKASHVSGYINLRDRPPWEEGAGDRADGALPLSLETAVAAVRRELLEDFTIDDPARNPELIDTVAFYYPDKENLFFYLFGQEISATHAFPDSVRMFGWTVGELLAVRRFHALTQATRSLNVALSEEQRQRVGALVRLNLLAHGEPELAVRFGGSRPGGTDPADLREDLLAAARSNRVRKYMLGRELEVHGLAGLQYRIFFSHLLPSYARLGVPGVGDLLAGIMADHDRSDAVDQLARHYSDERVVCSLPIEV